MSKKVIVIIAVVVFLAAAGFGIYKFTCTNNTEIKSESGFDPKNGTYLIDDKAVTLKDGYAEAEIVPGAASKEIVRYFGNEAKGDFDGNGQEDAVFILTREMGGSGVFYYVAAILGNGSGTNALPIGDRIAPETSEFRNGMIIVNYADRKPEEDFSAEPSVGVSRYFRIVDGTLFELMPTLAESEAKTIAEKSCIKGGEALGGGTYNENTRTWWFDANLNATREGCNPACVVDEETKKAEINWRCTGLVVPE
jgi:hypothetical protein